jgi:hypothetical protein
MLNNIALNKSVMHTNDRMFEIRDLSAGFKAVEGAYARNNRIFSSVWTVSFTCSVVPAIVGAAAMAYEIYKTLPPIDL